MKKIGIIMIVGLLSVVLVACTNKITVPDFVGEDYGDVLTWAKEEGVTVNISSEYNDDVLPRSVITQSVTPGDKITTEVEIDIVYSRGYDPYGEITVPDFTGKTVEDIAAWIKSEDIGKYDFYDTFDPTVVEGGYVGYEVVPSTDSTSYLRRDTYQFYFSKGALTIEDVNFDEPGTLRGVNLGGWFVLEGWMAPDLFSGVSGSDETIFMEEKPNALTEIEQHWDTFITEDDFAYLAAHGIDYVRLPIPWWLRGDEFTYTANGVTHTVQYGNSVQYIERALTWAQKYNIKVLLDLHTAPGCQNGFDNGGITGVLQWQRSENVAKTVEVISYIAEHFSSYSSLWGIEVLNEPAWEVDLNLLQQYYIDAYDAIRQYNPDVWVGFHDGFRNYLTSSWTSFFEDNNFTNVFFDIHLYQTFGDDWANYDVIDHVNFVHNQQYNTIHQYDGVVPIVIGEWSLGLQGNVFEGLNQEATNDVRMAFGNAQLNVYEDAFGWFFWSYKIDRTSHLEWDMRRLIDQGIFPSDFSDQ